MTASLIVIGAPEAHLKASVGSLDGPRTDAQSSVALP
jgi:hypothetical protein